MRYTVRTKEGSLTYGSMAEVEKAYSSGLVEPEDEIQEEGATAWRKASSIPTLVRARKATAPGMKWERLTLVFVAAAAFALYNLAKGRLVIGVLTAIVVSFFLTRLTYKAFGRKKPPNF